MEPNKARGETIIEAVANLYLALKL